VGAGYEDFHVFYYTDYQFFAPCGGLNGGDLPIDGNVGR
jgi:hypothetical protein